GPGSLPGSNARGTDRRFHLRSSVQHAAVCGVRRAGSRARSGESVWACLVSDLATEDRDWYQDGVGGDEFGGEQIDAHAGTDASTSSGPKMRAIAPATRGDGLA